MNYRHTFHAGNFADVHKHVALTAILLHLRRKQKPFVVIDTHAGRGLYDLRGAEALKTLEAARGISALAGYSSDAPTLATYLEIARGAGEQKYPGSPIIAAKLLRKGDRLVAIEQQAEEFATLCMALRQYSNARALHGDGYAQLRALLPPPERRALILIDPPYEDPKEMEHMSDAFRDMYFRFASGIFAFWYPLKLASRIVAFAGELKAYGHMKVLSLAIDVGAVSGGGQGPLSAAGLLVWNPPYGLDETMRAVCSEILPLLRRGPSARATVEWLDGDR
jgi:23S rRNA (adenine2030-N6)-methyltransferase